LLFAHTIGAAPKPLGGAKHGGRPAVFLAQLGALLLPPAHSDKHSGLARRAAAKSA